MLDKLLAYQEVDKELREYEKELSANEDRKKSSVAKKFLESVPETLEKLELASQELVSSHSKILEKIQSLQAKEDEYSKTVEEMQSADEGAYLLKKTEEVLAEIKGLGEELARVESEMQRIAKEYGALRVKTKEMQVVYKESAEKYKAFRDGKAELKADIDKRLEDAKKEVEKADAEIMALYDRKRKDEKMFPVLVEALTIDKTSAYCGHCRTELSLQDLSKLGKGEIIECGSCRRLIYKKG